MCQISEYDTVAYARIVERRILNMSEYGSICLNAPQLGLILPECTVLTMPGFSICLIILDIWQGFQYASGIRYASVLNMLRYSYNNIIIVTNVIIIEFLSTRFVHPEFRN